MITNLWKNISIVCGCHKFPIPLQPHTGSGSGAQGGMERSMFYTCPKYYPDQRDSSEKPCFNRISIGDYEKMVLHLSECLEAQDGSVVNLAGMRWKSKNGIEFHVLEHSQKNIIVSVKNRRLLS